MIKKCGGFLLVISFTMCVSQDQHKERSIQDLTYRDRLHKFIRPYINYLLGRSTARERKMLKSKAKRDAVVAASSAVAVGGVAIGIKMASPTLRQKISKWIQEKKSNTQKESEKQEIEMQQSTEPSSAASKPITSHETLLENKKYTQKPKTKIFVIEDIIQMTKSKKQDYKRYKIENHIIHMTSEEGKIFFIFEQPTIKILNTAKMKSDYTIQLHTINKELVRIICDLAKVQIKSRVFIPIEKEFCGEEFDKSARMQGSFLEYYEQPIQWHETYPIRDENQELKKFGSQTISLGITPWDWTQEFYSNKKKNF